MYLFNLQIYLTYKVIVYKILIRDLVEIHCVCVRTQMNSRIKQEVLAGLRQEEHLHNKL